MKCPLCRAPVRAVDKYCPYCNRPLPRVEEAPVAPEPGVAPVSEPAAVSGFDALVEFGAQTWGGEPAWFPTTGLVSRVAGW